MPCLEKGYWRDPLTCYHIALNIPNFYVVSLEGEMERLWITSWAVMVKAGSCHASATPPPPNTHTLSLAADFSLWKQDGGGVCCFWDRILGVDCVTRLSCSSGQSFWPQFLPASLCPPSFHSVCGIMSRSWRRVLIIVFAGLVDA